MKLMTEQQTRSSIKYQAMMQLVPQPKSNVISRNAIRAVKTSENTVNSSLGFFRNRKGITTQNPICSLFENYVSSRKPISELQIFRFLGLINVINKTISAQIKIRKFVEIALVEAKL